MGSTAYPARRSIACRNPHKRSNPHESLYPSRLPWPFPQFPKIEKNTARIFLKRSFIRNACHAPQWHKQFNFQCAYLNWRDSISTRRALRREHCVVISYTIDLIVNVDRESNAIETVVAHATPKAARMIWFTHGLQYLRKAKVDVILNYNEDLTDDNNRLSSLTISMIRWPQIAHFSAVCWKPEYCEHNDLYEWVYVN